MRILVVEDEERIANLISKALKGAGYIVDVAGDGQSGLYAIKVHQYNLLVLDLNLPDLDGVKICRQLRKEGFKLPILMLTARDSLDDKIKGLDSGADDYLTKPFSFDELLARARSLLRREGVEKDPVMKLADLTMDSLSRKVARGGQAIQLNNKEYHLLEYLLAHKEQLVTREQILEYVWGETGSDVLSNTIDVHIRYLRRKIDNSFDKKLIHTLRGQGYILSEQR